MAGRARVHVFQAEALNPEAMTLFPVEIRLVDSFAYSRIVHGCVGAG